MHHHHPPAQTQQRRRKKRPNYGTRTVEVRRGYNGFGFTISGQQPCRLSCIVTNSPADQAGLRAGDFLISVNNLNVSKLPHETVVQLIGNSFGSIRMQIAENYFSDSSDEENALLLQSGLGGGASGTAGSTRQKPSYLHHKMKMNRLRNSPQKSRSKVGASVMPASGATAVTVARPEAIGLRPVIEDIPLLALGNPGTSLMNVAGPNGNNSKASTTAYDVIPKANANISNDISNVSAMVRVPAPTAAAAAAVGADACGQPHVALEYRAIVGYLGTIEMPRQISNSSKLQTVRSCIRKLRQEKRQPTTVLMTILPDCLRLQASNGSVLATYTSARLNYVSSSSESENRFFGLVTSSIHTSQADEDDDEVDVEDDGGGDGDGGGAEAVVRRHPQRIGQQMVAGGSNISISNSCHVFVIDTKLCEHQAHLERAHEFRIDCTKDPISNLCLEFPNNSEYVVNLIRSMYTMRILPPASRHSADRTVGQEPGHAQAHSPQPSNHSEVSTTTSNSDSGIGFHNDCTNISDRILVVDFPGAQMLGGIAPARLARPLGIFNNIDAAAGGSGVGNANGPDKRLTVRAMPDPKTPPLARIPPTGGIGHANAPPNLLASFNLIKSPANSLTATRSCDDVLSLMERSPEQEFSLASSVGASSLQQRKSMQMSMDDISLHSTSQLYKQTIEAPSPIEHTFLHPACVALPPPKKNSNSMSYSLQQECRTGVRSSLQHVPSKLSPKVYGMPPPTAAVVNTQSTEDLSVATIHVPTLSRSRRSLGYRPSTSRSTRGESFDDEFETWSSLQDIHAIIERCEVRNSDQGVIDGTFLEATNSEPDLGNRALPANASPFRRAWGQSSFRTPRTDKHALHQNRHHQSPQSPLVRRTASMTASDNDVYVKSMDTYIIDELKATRSQQQIAGSASKTSLGGGSNSNSNSSSNFNSTSNFHSHLTASKSTGLSNGGGNATATSTTTTTTTTALTVVPVGVAAWGTAFERLLEDPAGLHTFAEFLKKEFSAENIYFWTACERFRHLESETERATQAMAIYTKHLAKGSSEPVNVDSQARNLTEERLQSGERDIFAPAQKQIFNLMKFDSYQRFIRSDLYKSCLEAEEKQQPLPYTAEDLDDMLRTNFHLAASSASASASSKLKKSASNAEDRRRKSLLPWHRKTRCKSRDRSETSDGKLSTSSSTHNMGQHHQHQHQHHQATAPSKLPQLSSSSLKIPSSSHSNSVSDIHSSRSSLSSFDTLPGGNSNGQLEEIKPCSLCRVILSDGATTIVQTRSGDTVGQLVERLLEKRGLSYHFYDVVINGCSKSIDLESAAQTLAGKEVLIEQRVTFKLDLPDPKVISVKSKPKKQLHEVIRPILQKYNYCMDAVQVLMRDTHEQLDLAQSVTVADGKRLQIVLLKAPPVGDLHHHPPASSHHQHHQNGGKMTKSVSFPTATKLATAAATRTAVGVVAAAAASTTTATNPHQSTLDEITNKVFNELLQSKVEAHASGVVQTEQKPSDMCSLKSDDCASETSSVFDRMRRRDSNIPGMMKPKPKKKNSTSQSDETINAINPQPSGGEAGIVVAPVGGGVKKPIIAKLKAGVKLQVTERIENQDELLEGLKRAQLARLEDQRGTEINFELPDFLKNKENLSAANKLRKVRANLSPVNKSVTTSATPTSEEPPSPLGERPQPAPRLSITNKHKAHISPMKIDEEETMTVCEKQTANNSNQNNNNNNNNNTSNSSIESSDYATTKGPPPLPPKPKVLPIKPSNWGVSTSSSSSKQSATSSSTTPVSSNAPANVALPMPSKIPIVDISRKHLGSEQTGRCAYLEEPSSSFV